MNADSGVDPIVLLGEWESGVELFWTRPGANSEKRGDARGASAFEHGVAIVRELREINVGVRIDKIHCLRRQVAATIRARYIVPLLYAGADFDVFVGEAGKDRTAFGANGSGDNHAVRLHATEFAGSQIYDHRDLASDQFV